MKETIPGIALSVIPVVLLAIVSFNTPLLKSLFFLKAEYSGFEATFGTLGYCTNGGVAVTNGSAVDADGCVGPTIGYTFDPDAIFALQNPIFDIPNVVTKYLTYVLFLHVVGESCGDSPHGIPLTSRKALCTGVAGILLSLLDLIPNFSLLCFPAFFQWLTSALSLISFIIDAIMFYIARARINNVSGATATIGVCVWLTLAAWVLTAISGCVLGFGKCCARGNKRNQSKTRGDRAYEAMRQEQDAQAEWQREAGARGGKRVGPPVKEEEVSVPLTATDKYLNDDDEEDKHGTVPYGSAVNGVGYGYGQGYPPQPQHAPPPRQVTPPRTDRGYVPSASAYPTQPFPAQDPATPYADPYTHPQTEYLAQQQEPYAHAHGSPVNLVPGLPPVAGVRSMTPASTYAGSFVGVGSGRHEGMVMPGLPEGAVANVAAYGQGGHVLQGGYAGAGQTQGGYDAYGGQQRE